MLVEDGLEDFAQLSGGRHGSGSQFHDVDFQIGVLRQDGFE
jgi:hypothetical protein